MIRINITDGRLAKTAKRLHREKALGHEKRGEFLAWLHGVSEEIVYSISYPLETESYEMGFLSEVEKTVTVGFMVDYIKRKIEARANYRRFFEEACSIPGAYVIRGRNQSGSICEYHLNFSVKGTPGRKICTIERRSSF